MKPHVRRLFPILSACLLLGALGCGPKHVVHPGAVDNFDSNVYDTLTIAQGVLDQAKTEFAQGKLPATAKTVINDAGGAYNLLRDAWLGYRAVKQTNPSDPAQEYVAKINALLPQINQFIADLRKLLGKSATKIPFDRNRTFEPLRGGE